MAGLAERQSDPADSFWTWRETMYAMAARFTPELLRDVAAQLYVEMLEAGYTSVCEFHYLHHAPDGRPYADPAAMSRALVDAARATGIRLTLLPVLYMTGGFDARALSPRQARFGHEVDAYLRLLEALRPQQDERLRIGCALHSLRAVPPAAMREVLAALPSDSRIHIHIAEQVAEVEECIAVRGARPVQWLLDNAAVDARWTLVHATHLDDGEVRGIARSGATVAICPTTEANLGDGLFPFVIIWMKAVHTALVRIRTSRWTRWRNCAGWNTASASCPAAATSPPVPPSPAWARRCCRACWPAP